MMSALTPTITAVTATAARQIAYGHVLFVATG
jgi:hypothetical protein